MNTSAAAKLKPGDRVVFLGDAITQAGARPGGYVNLFREAVDREFAGESVEVVGAGLGGNRVPDCEQRLQRDVLAHHPTHVVIYIGINDVWHATRGQGTPRERFRDGLADLVGRCQAEGVKVFLCTPSVIGEKTDGTNSMDLPLDEYAQICRDVTQLRGAELVDLRVRFLEHLSKINPANKPHSMLTTDGVHLNAMGNRFVADCILESFGVESSAAPDQVLRHVVLLKFKAATSPAVIAGLDQAFRALQGKIPEVLSLEAGRDNSPEGLSKGFTHVYVVTFRGENERAIYLPHAEHLGFVGMLKPHLDDVLVVDFWAEASEPG